MLHLPHARRILAATLVAALLTPALSDPAQAQATMRRIEPGVLTPQGCATGQILARSSRGFLILRRAQSSAARAWHNAVREAGYHGQPFQDWQRARNVQTLCTSDMTVAGSRVWQCRVSGTPCNPSGGRRVTRPNQWQVR